MKQFVIFVFCLCFGLESLAQKSDLERLNSCKSLLGNVVSVFDTCISRGDIISSRECFDNFLIILDIELCNYPIRVQKSIEERAYEYGVYSLVSQLRSTVGQSEPTDVNHLQSARLDLIATIEASCFDVLEKNK